MAPIPHLVPMAVYRFRDCLQNESGLFVTPSGPLIDMKHIDSHEIHPGDVKGILKRQLHHPGSVSPAP